LSKDNLAPHRFAIRGDRQVLSTGIWILTILSALLLIAVSGNTNALIPLFAIGVFTGFTLSQSGLVVHWIKSRASGWQYKIIINGLGALVTAISTIVFLITKFTGGAWIVVVAVPILIVIFMRIEKYYLRVGSELKLGKLPGKPKPEKTTVVVPISQISKLTEHAIAEARSLSDDVIALFVINKVPIDDPSNPKMSDSDAAAEAIVAQWEKWNPGVRLEVLESDYASIIEPIVGYIDELRKQVNHQIVVLIPVIVSDKVRYRILHNQIDLLLSNALSDRTDLIVARAKYQLSAQS
jgi:hypothetical protein